MAHDYINGTAWIAITPALVDRMDQLGAKAIERLRRFGLAERRETAWSVVVAGGVPLIGMLVLGWPPAGTVLCVLLNLLILLAEDHWKILRARGALAGLQRYCTQDAFVWPLARAMARGSRTVYGRTLPTLDQLDAGAASVAPFVLSLVALCAVVMPAWLLHVDKELYVEPATLALATLPNLLLFAGASVLQSTRRNESWRDAGSARLATTEATALLTLILGMTALGLFVVVAPNPAMSPASFAGLFCVAVVALGVHRLLASERMRQAADWLERRLHTRDLARTPSRQSAEVRQRLAQRFRR